MPDTIKQFNTEQLRKIKSEIRAGDTVKVHQIISDFDAEKEKTQIFEGIVLARKHGKGLNATITVRATIDSIGVEKIFPLHSPIIKQIDIIKRAKVRRAKLYYLRTAQGKRARLKTQMTDEKVFEEKIPVKNEAPEETPGEEIAEKATIEEKKEKVKVEPKTPEEEK
ncbi:50S ribosomal protein L19 [Patescibacteria group bacterium]|nr:50S ribosomal protein L19 [Patescibacteria group bacterium]MBU4023343.1 50S ribosomal protein L19 [Patescibacteria group bacterium]